jgi:hypothetical protein
MGMTEKSKDKTQAQSDSDSLDRLSLSIVPLTTSTLKNARLIKNGRMETAVELHNDPISGSLQIKPEDISEAFKGAEKDQQIITALSELNSYDVYSMRSSLKQLGIPVSDDALKLSDTMKAALNGYALEFVRPLVERIFGSANADVDASEGGESLNRILKDSDVGRVRRNLATITNRTGIPTDEIPTFLEMYSDVFLSVAYYRHCYAAVEPDVQRFMIWVKELEKHRDVMTSPQTMNSCKKVEATMKFLSASIRERFAKFHTSFEVFWDNISKKAFDELRQQIEENHTSMGAVLCGLGVKMNNWTQAFPDNTVGGPAKRAKFVMTEMEPGIEKLKMMENEARRNVGLPV